MKKESLCDLLLLKKHHTKKILNVIGFSIFMIFLCAFTSFANIPEISQQGNTITGVVVDNYGDPVIGANVIQKGTTNGTITDFDGNYSITVPQGAILQISYIGYLTQEITVGSQRSINITLIEDTQTLDEVVVVGYGTMKKSDVTGSISVTTADDILKGQTFGALDGLKGKAAGVNIFSNSGQPGGASRVIIRGMSTVNSSSDPLYVVDGVVMEDFKYLNPGDIERIEVLKDASSAAIYGARGANGVILVTTKRGLKGDGVSVSYDGSLSIGTMARYMDLLDANDWMEAFKQGLINANTWDGKDRSTNLADYFTDPRLFNADGTPKYNTDWQKESTRTTVSHSHQLNIQQGGPNSSVGAFLNYTDQQGLMLNSYLKRVNAKLAYDTKPSKYLSTAVNLLVNHTWGNEGKEDGGEQMPRRTMIEMVPWMPVQFPDGEWSNSTTVSDNVGIEGMANPVHVLKTQQRMRYKTQVFGNAALTFHILPGLDLKTQLGVDAHFNKDRDYTPNDLVDLDYPHGKARIESYTWHYWQEETYLTYNTTVNNKHRINAMAGLSWQERVYRRDKMEASGFSDNFSGFDRIQSATNPSAPESEYQRWAMNSYFLRAAYTYNDKYSATVTGRIDGSSKFGDNNKYAFFPSAGLAWITSSEDFMKDISFIDQFKLHTSYGVTGNSEIGVYESLARISASTVLLNGIRVPSAYVSGLSNPDLKWEKTHMWDIGFNLNLLGNRLNFDISYYYKVTKDLLMERPVPYSTGYSKVMDNIGEVENKGIDFMLNTVNITSKDFEWTSNLNFNYNKNKIVKLGENDEDINKLHFVNNHMVKLRVGESLASFWGSERLGVWTPELIAQAKENGEAYGRIGESRYGEDKILGKGLPDITGSFINNFRYKNFDLSLDLQFVLGVDIMQQFLHSTEDRFAKANGLKTILTEGYNGTNPNTMVQAIRNDGATGDGHLSRVDSHWVCDGSYLRANLIQLGYTFDKKMTDKMKINSLRVNFSVNNAFLITSKDFKGYDPEASSHSGSDGNRWGQNIFFFQYPKPRTYTLGVNVTF